MEDAHAIVVLQRRALLQSDIQSGGACRSEWHRVHRFTPRRFRSFPASTTTCQRVIPHISRYKTEVRCCAVPERWVFPTFPGLFGLQQEITREHLRTRAFSQKITRAWHHSRSLVHAEERARRLPEELCFSWEKKPSPFAGWMTFVADFFGKRQFNA